MRLRFGFVLLQIALHPNFLKLYYYYINNKYIIFFVTYQIWYNNIKLLYMSTLCFNMFGDSFYLPCLLMLQLV